MTRILPLVALMFFVGCQAKLTVSKTYTLPDGPTLEKPLEMPAQPSPQTLTITVNVKSGDSIDVFVLKADDFSTTTATQNDEKKLWESKALGFKRDMKSETFNVKIPANVKYFVVSCLSEKSKAKTEYELKVTN
jgi:uncharacterized lipoprotein YmbA